ncbi:unnamed protein product [Diatraea saccharalis]|uniref:Uncharacterized protein n=1 Tax=Diatraea saccharalis TaxID=40085 RepID=A0A9N9W8P4_9NEOP|nr:unnamed protein product [Diatraea saccharalis]
MLLSDDCFRCVSGVNYLSSNAVFIFTFKMVITVLTQLLRTSARSAVLRGDCSGTGRGWLLYTDDNTQPKVPVFIALYNMIIIHHHHHQPINLFIAGAQAFPVDGIELIEYTMTHHVDPVRMGGLSKYGGV